MQEQTKEDTRKAFETVHVPNSGLLPRQCIVLSFSCQQPAPIDILHMT
jgi:hypothetical protein